jgi:hypothetical protein
MPPEIHPALAVRDLFHYSYLVHRPQNVTGSRRRMTGARMPSAANY